MFVLFAFIAACATPADDSHARIEALEQVWHASDAAQIEPILAPDFERRMPNGEIWNRERQLAWLSTRPPAPGFTHRFESMTIDIDGDTAVATGIATLVSAEGAVVDRNAFTDVYVRRDGAWRLRSAERSQVR